MLAVCALDSSAPPTTDRGVEIGEGVSLDWIEFSVPAPLDVVKTRLETADECVPLPHGSLGYAHAEVGHRGVMLFWDEDRPEVHVRMSGVVAAQFWEAEALSVLAWVLEMRGGFSRLDLQATVSYDLATVVGVRAAFDRREAVTHCRKAVQIEAFDPHGAPLPSDEAGMSLYLGATSSDRRLRIYDKGAQSAGQISGTRFELQERNKYADEAARQLVAAGAVTPVMRGRLVGFVDFRLGDGDVDSRERACGTRGWSGRLRRCAPCLRRPAERSRRRLIR